MSDRGPQDARCCNTDPTPQVWLARAYDAHAAGLYRYALVVLADPTGAEDAVQQAFVKVAAMRGRGETVREVEPYLRTAVRNECWRILRDRKARKETALPAGDLLEPVTNHTAPDERLALVQALRSLPAEQREVVHLRVFEQMTFQQIAEWLKVSINTAASRYRYAVQKLRQALGEADPPEA